MSNVMVAEPAGAPSPFFQGTNHQCAWDSTSIGWAKTCPRLYYYSMVCGYRSKGENVHLRFGIEYHKALQDYDTFKALGEGHDQAVHSTITSLMERLGDYPEPDQMISKSSVKLKTKANLIRTVVWYLDCFVDDAAETFILKNGEPAVEQSFRFELGLGVGNQPYILCGHLDRIVKFNDELFVMDRKTTTSTIGPYWFDQFEPNNQMTTYTFAGQIILQAPVKGVIIDAAQVAVTFSRFQRSITYRSQDQLDEWYNDLEHLLRTFQSYADEEYWPQNDTACDKFGGCRFRSVCSRSPSVRQAFLDSDFEREHPWNPLEIR